MKKFDIVSFNEVMGGRSKMVKDILDELDGWAEKYKIEPEDFHKMRMLVRARSFFFVNLWLKYLGQKVSPKYYYKINTKGENLDKEDESIS